MCTNAPLMYGQTINAKRRNITTTSNEVVTVPKQIKLFASPITVNKFQFNLIQFNLLPFLGLFVRVEKKGADGKLANEYQEWL